mmetsp:Transcript_11606/g.29719  ORF Transcript_11606/g.29719 Transcript_11606/m.29719 type:complete len:248 (+) Transcript_11606:150-893(+)
MQMCRHQRFLALAAVEAEQSIESTKHGALLVRGGKVLGSGHNSARSRNASVPGAANAISLHSEVRSSFCDLPRREELHTLFPHHPAFDLPTWRARRGRCRSCRWRLFSPFRGFYRAQAYTHNDTPTKRNKFRHCDLYVVRVLPEGRQFQGTTERDPARFGFSQPCMRCLRTLEVFGVQRVIFSTGHQSLDGNIGFEIHNVIELLRNSSLRGHRSRGDEEALACGALRCHEVSAGSGQSRRHWSPSDK